MTASPNLKKIVANINEYLLIFCSLLIIFGAVIYYFYALNWAGVIVTLSLTLAAFIPFTVFRLKKQAVPTLLTYQKTALKYYIYPLIYLFFCGWSFYVLYSSQSSRALISPWQVVSPHFFWLYTLATASLIFLLIKKELNPGLKIALLSLHYFLTLAVAFIVYKIGYGFDPFIHQATMDLIDKKGLVDPKTPYYLGQYALIITGHKVFGLSIFVLNKILVPLLASFFVPLAAYRFLKRADTDENKQASWSEFLTVLFLLALTFAPFIATTPQNLAYLFLLLTIFVGLSRSSPLVVLILALATTAIHPLSGLPALAWSAWLFLHCYREYVKPLWRKLLTALIFVGSALLLPLALWLSGGGNWKEIAPGLANLTSPFKNLFVTLGTAGREDWLSNFLYFFANNYSLLLIILILVSLIYFYAARPRLARRAWRENGLLLVISSLLLAYIFSSQIHFDNLISYEQNNYADRILIIMTLFSLPYLITALNRLIKKIGQTEKTGRVIWFIFGLALITAALYLSYPRFDKYYNSRGYSTSQSDVTAVDLIAAQSNKPYIVLADQQVSAAALKELGFDHYYPSPTGPIYFYPIPTGGPLYQYYLDMVYKTPDRTTMNKALKLAGVSEGYLVVNKYWYQSDRVIGMAKLTAASWQSVNNEVYIFKY